MTYKNPAWQWRFNNGHEAIIDGIITVIVRYIEYIYKGIDMYKGGVVTNIHPGIPGILLVVFV